MKKLSAISMALMAISFSGCAIFSPSYEKPNVDEPTQMRNGMQVESSNSDLSQLQWWKKVNDPVLNQLIETALANNNQIQVAQGNIMQAQAKLRAAKYAWIPTLNAGGGAFTGNTWATTFTPQGTLASTPGITNGSMANTGFNGLYGSFIPSYSFNVFANISQEKLAKASLDMQKASYNATRLAVISQVTGSYFMLLGQRKQLALQEQMIADNTELRKLQMVSVKNGASDMSQIALTDQKIAAAQAQIPAIKNAISQTENALQVLLNKNPGPIVSNGDIDKLNIEGVVPANLPSAVLKNRPDILMAEDNLRIANANIGLANSMFFPTISLTGFIGGASEALQNLFSLGTGFWVAQAAASMPILNASSFEEVKAAKGGYYVAYYNYMQTVKTAFSDVDNSLTNKLNMDLAYNATKKSYDAANEYYRLSQVKYSVGAKDLNDVVNAKLNLDTAAQNLNQARLQQLDAIVTVYQSLAGGYAAESELSKPKQQ